MAKIKIQNFNICYSKTDLNIIDSYKIHDIKEMESFLIEALNTIKIYKTNRTINSLINEWITHNALYKMHLFRKRTKDCNFESQQKRL